MNTHHMTCDTCGASGPGADNAGVARFRALLAGWTTARGRKLCTSCTAEHNAQAASQEPA